MLLRRTFRPAGVFSPLPVLKRYETRAESRTSGVNSGPSRDCADGHPVNAAYRFGRFELQSGISASCSSTGSPRALGARAFDLLLALIERRDRLVTKNELLDVVWPGLVVEENNLQVQISALRKLLGPQVIATDPRARLPLHRGARRRAASGANAAAPSRLARRTHRPCAAAPLDQPAARSCRGSTAATPTSPRCAR